jgi:hypothetical protein
MKTSVSASPDLDTSKRRASARAPLCAECARGAQDSKSEAGPPGAGPLRAGRSFADVPLRSGKAEAAFGEDDATDQKGEDGGVPPVTTTPATPPTTPPVTPPAAPATPAAPAAVLTPVPSIAWNAPTETVGAGNGSSTTVETEFSPSYTADQDAPAGLWRMAVSSISGGTTISLQTGGSRDPTSSPPTTEAEAAAAVTVMKGYYSRGSRGSWHTVGASRQHELHHNREWHCSAEHYWAIAGPAIAALTVPLSAHADSASAATAMKPRADAKIASFKAAARTYWFTLSDSASAKPYAAGQAVLNGAVGGVQLLAAANSWTVEAGTTATSGTEPPCYQAYAAYTP